MAKYKTLKWGLLFFAITTVILKGNAQSFDGSKFYRLTTEWQGEGKSLDVLNDGKNNQLQLADSGNFSGQNWKITPLGNGYYRLTTLWLGEGRSLDVVNDGKNNQPQLAQTGDFSGQYWKITDLSESATVTPGIIKPPFHGTIFISSDILTAVDPTTFSTLEDAGQADRTMFDRREGFEGAFITLKPYLFIARYTDNLSIEMQVNPEFGSVQNARAQARKYAEVIGRLPMVLRKDVKTSWIHQGDKLFGGGNNNLLIHTGQAAEYEKDGILEEALIHEGAHSSLDAEHAQSQGWQVAQKVDSVFISTYAQENPTREDIAESFIFYLALQYRSNRISKELKETIEKSIPNRMEYFKQQNFNVYPWK
jgi:hypothetical protein